MKFSALAATVSVALLTTLPAGLVAAQSAPLAAPPTIPTTLPTVPATTDVPPVVPTGTPVLPVGTPVPSIAPAAPSGAPIAVANDYKLDVDDVINIGVTRHGDVGGTYRIPPDGLLRLQRLTTPIDARGKTIPELIATITTRLQTEGKLVLRPGQVTVFVSGLRLHPVYIRGNAVGGRMVDLRPGWRLDDLVATMGTIPQADRVTVRITNPLRPAPVPINLGAALVNPNSPENVLLMEGDTLVVMAPENKRLTIEGEGPKGVHEFDERYGLRAALLSLGFTTNGATGDLRHSRIIRHTVPGDLSSASQFIPIDLYELMTDAGRPDRAFQDFDTLDIPVSQDYVYVMGEIGGSRKWFLPQDRKTYLVDVYANAGDVSPNAKMGSVKVFHQEQDGTWDNKTYDLGKFLNSADAANNPEIYPHDMIYVPTNRHVDPVNTIFTGWSIFSILKALAPGL